MRWFILLAIISLTLDTMGQYNKQDFIGTYYNQQIASGKRARVDRANHYRTITLKKDDSFLWTHQDGRLTAEFRYEYGTWEYDGEHVILNHTHEVWDRKRYPKRNGGYQNNPYDKSLEKKPSVYSHSLRIEEHVGGRRVRGLKHIGNVYDKS